GMDGDYTMTTGANPETGTPATKSRFTARRIGLLAGVAGMATAIFFTAPGIAPTLTFAPAGSAAYAQNAQRPVGFADIVDAVKPAVISVRVKVDAGPRLMGFEGNNSPVPPGSPMDRFFRRFGLPDGMPGDNNSRTPNRRNFVTGQGSGFFISA